MGHAYGAEQLQSMVPRETWLSRRRWDTCAASFFVLSGNSKINALLLCLICVISFSSQSNLYFSFLSLSCLNLLLFPLFVLLSVFSGFFFLPPPSFLTLDLFSLWFLFLQQSISLFNLMLFSCLSRLCVWFSFSWRLAGKRAGFYPKILFLKKKKKEKKNMTTLVFSPGKV